MDENEFRLVIGDFNLYYSDIPLEELQWNKNRASEAQSELVRQLLEIEDDPDLGRFRSSSWTLFPKSKVWLKYTWFIQLDYEIFDYISEELIEIARHLRAGIELNDYLEYVHKLNVLESRIIPQFLKQFRRNLSRCMAYFLIKQNSGFSDDVDLIMDECLETPL